ncbi:MAG: hypothetical protein ABIB11_04205 [Candidatus Omnitrophota bacterium]
MHLYNFDDNDDMRVAVWETEKAKYIYVEFSLTHTFEVRIDKEKKKEVG